MKQIPNLFTLLNLVFGCIAIVLILQTGESIIALDASGSSLVVLPEKIWQGALFIFAAAVVDFLDGFLARLFKAESRMGAQLDSLSDVVSFGVAPGMILYQLLRMSYAQQENGLDVSVLALIPAFIYTSAVAWRLAMFNISTNQVSSFRGIPSPAAGLLVASLPLVMMDEIRNAGPDDNPVIGPYLVNKWVLYGTILLLSYLMLSNRRFMALKFKTFSFRDNALFYVLLAIGLISIFLFKWLGVPIIFLAYVIISIFAKEETVPMKNRDSLDVPV